MDSEVISKHVATLRSEDVKGWRLSLLDNLGRRTYSSPVVREPITLTVSHDIKAGSIEDSGLVQSDFVAGGSLKIQGSGLLAPHLEFGSIGLEVWSRVDLDAMPPDLDYLKRKPLRWWIFPCVIRGKMCQSSQWGDGPDGNLPIDVDAMWQFITTEMRPEFAEQPE